MVIMDSYYASDRLQESWKNIDQLHLSYLEMEDSPEKLEHRNRLEDCIRDFLCMTSPSQKFTFPQTAEVLYRSAASKKDFSGYKAATGWNTIQLYAGNLLSQPWRREYKQVKTYSGFYKHQIEANLMGAELMFEIMGYKRSGDGILLLLDGPICPDTVTTLSKDCLMAYVECQILKEIWEELSPSCKSWMEVLEFRKNHLCTPEQSIRALNYQHQQRQYQVSQNSDIYSRPHQSSFPPLAPPPVAQTLPYGYSANTCCSNNYGTYAHSSYSVSVPCPHKQNFSNGYYYSNGYVGASPHPIYGYTVPTAQLIDFESQQMDVDRPLKHKNSLQDSRRKTESKAPKDTEKYTSDDWDYVYRDLESRGYSKDFGERGDLLTPKKIKNTNLDEAMNHLTVRDRPLRVTEALEKFETNNRNLLERRPSNGSSYENLSEAKKPALKVVKPKNSYQQKVVNNNNSATKSTKWECQFCTYHNDQNKDVCEICSKSRVIQEEKMEIGGPQCPQCTLVNMKNTKVCQACGTGLENSPTYI